MRGGGPSRTKGDYGARAQGRAGFLHQGPEGWDADYLHDPPLELRLRRRVGVRDRAGVGRQQPRRGVPYPRGRPEVPPRELRRAVRAVEEPTRRVDASREEPRGSPGPIVSRDENVLVVGALASLIAGLMATVGACRWRSSEISRHGS